ncbi:MAG: phytoene desaturase [Sphingobacteriales bacterium]|nr:MAG: phytoene desaturase [Sphingobacteriales bacterium]TAF82578.1 MAG: phytoene desaturase [Sphingobacteriales bacterium]
MKHKRKAIIIGAGIAGIASAIRLAVKGYNVTVYEANAEAGGKLVRFKQGAYSFDAGPSLFTMPNYVTELFTLAGKKPEDYFTYQKLDEVCRYFWADGTTLSASADSEIFGQQVAEKTKSSALELNRYLKKSKTIYNITHHVFLEKSLQKLATYVSFKTLKSVFNFGKIDAFKTMAQANEAFFTDPKMVQYANRFATYNGSNPYQAPATLNVIPHLEQNMGAYFPDKGMYSIVQSLVKLAQELGVKFCYNTFVDEICVQHKAATGILIKDEFIDANVVVSNMDIYFTYTQLLRKQTPPKAVLKQHRSSSALIFYWGIKQSFAQLGLHNILFSDDYKAEFEAIFKQKSIAADATIYINISSKLKPDDAPRGCENWFVMINVPNNTGQNWDALIAKARTHIIQKINHQFGIDVQTLIENESILDPRSIQTNTQAYQGSLYGTSSNNQFAAFLRHANFSSKIKNLYFVGGSVHPGGGIPLSLLSANIVADLIKHG